MLFRGLMVTDLSGTLDGLVASRNRYGPYFRNHVIPTDPATEQQLKIRAAMADVQNAWRAMTDAQRSAWNSYAAGLTTTNRIGARHTLTGYAAWSQFALPQYQQVEALDPGRVVTVTPPAFPTADFTTAPSITLPDLTHFTLTWTDDGTWEGSTSPADGIIVHTGRPHTALRNWYQGPFIPTHWIESDEGSPPTSPLTLSIPVALQPASGQALDFRLRLFREDRPNGRLWQCRAVAP